MVALKDADKLRVGLSVVERLDVPLRPSVRLLVGAWVAVMERLDSADEVPVGEVEADAVGVTFESDSVVPAVGVGVIFEADGVTDCGRKAVPVADIVADTVGVFSNSDGVDPAVGVG